MTERSSEPTLILQSSDTRIVVHGSLFVGWNGENPAQLTYSWWAVRAHSEQVLLAVYRA
jgi:hypothetical protein